MPAGHQPVMPSELIQILDVGPGKQIADLTCGGGGHSIKFYEAMRGVGTLVCVDRDPEMLALAKRRFAERGVPEGFVRWVCGSFADLKLHLARLGIERCDAILADLGLSSDQLTPERGFSFAQDGPLDMRFSREEDIPTLGERLERIGADELEQALRAADERFARRIARAILRRRDQGPIRSTLELARVIRSAIPKSPEWRRIDPATKSFMALRMLVNDELRHIQKGLVEAIECLAIGGRIAVLSFHSGEDRVVKQTFRTFDIRFRVKGDPGEASGRPALELLTRKPVRPGEAECRGNPRARSAKLRAAVRVG
ncbi:MAG: 16S rRNA (cytosine(1402)-N(4))-methyltransferase RsmH [Candidatus Sumerlaeia bacterium]|nr:16S rRNA (cytosine(1402)-N(4))-methyltransferase RsmH [Candidatus Sumerlaeia bacterium]